MVAGDRALGRAWFGAAALASGAFSAVFVEAMRVANWDVDHPVPVPGDDSPGGGDMGAVFAVPFFALLAIVCLIFPLLWGITVMRRRKGRSVQELVVISSVLQGVALLLALPVASSLPYGWAGVTTLAAAELLALGIALQPLWSRRRAVTA
ncbi:hypothetical protein AB0C90_00640 [Streptomyces sp. NPDC048550]|uniref:hypothetical protein n=1 Tax=unclassified Streptomyces TaxID=2593676 RepID=UPI003447A4BE